MACIFVIMSAVTVFLMLCALIERTFDWDELDQEEYDKWA